MTVDIQTALHDDAGHAVLHDFRMLATEVVVAGVPHAMPPSTV